ncbi:conserved membrane hypothetical protein [Sphingomonas sp. T1]|uniref:DUF2306 domain-containing protein n=1 Tax=Sphingomonas sp. T1 TaxID=2653172 RepID=UPI0012F38762|nr:DUF2306 domain-containing protein [Sphingomonas sp. T1]VXD07389.1 conserved membrane hypothetical protein [Sphingomonas sp. T1]
MLLPLERPIMSVAHQMRPIRKPLRIATMLLATAIALVSYRYLADVGPMPSTIVANLFARPWLLVHVAGASTALLIGSVQFSGALRSRWPQVHRILGRVYVLGCLVGGLSGLVLAFGSTAGPIATAGFGLLGVAWITVNVQGWRYALLRRFPEHRGWMIRSWALTLSAVTLRVYLPLVPLLGLPFLESYRAISFLAWVPNLIVAEAYLRGWRLPGLQAAPVGGSILNAVPRLV